MLPAVPSTMTSPGRSRPTLRRADNPQRRPILYRTARIHELGLAEISQQSIPTGVGAGLVEFVQRALNPLIFHGTHLAELRGAGFALRHRDNLWIHLKSQNPYSGLATSVGGKSIPAPTVAFVP